MTLVRYVGRTQCIDPAYVQALDGGRDTLIDWVSRKPNATRGFQTRRQAFGPRD